MKLFALCSFDLDKTVSREQREKAYEELEKAPGLFRDIKGQDKWVRLPETTIGGYFENTSLTSRELRDSLRSDIAALFERHGFKKFEVFVIVTSEDWAWGWQESPKAAS